MRDLVAALGHAEVVFRSSEREAEIAALRTKAAGADPLFATFLAAIATPATSESGGEE